ncbi:MAG: hypothetical protein ACTSXQ_06640 [Alphaproteobacteria bacterium]
MPKGNSRIFTIQKEKRVIHFNEDTLTISLPIRITMKNARKVIEPINGVRINHPDFTLIKAIARAFIWQEKLDKKEFQSIRDIAYHEKLGNGSYASRIMRLTTLSPKIVKAILRGTQPPSVTLKTLLKPFPYIWKEQEVFFGL